MKRNFHIKSAVACLLVMFIAASLLITGCGGGGGGTSSYSPGYSDNTQSTTCTVSGVCKEKDGTTVIPGATVSITDSGVIKSKGARGFSFSTVADGSGVYFLTNVPPGTYVITVTANGHVTQVYQGVSVTGDMTKNLVVISTSDWNAVMGDTTHPYDSAKGYIQVNAVTYDSAGKATPVSDVVVGCTPATGLQIGYMTSGVVNWTAKTTTADGQALIYGVTPGTSYAITGKRDFYSFNTVSAATATAGTITVYELSSVNEGANLVSISVSPATASVPAGYSKQFKATGQYSNGQSQDVTDKCTWSSSTDAGTIGNGDSTGAKGFFTAVKAGPTTLKASAGTISGSASITVTDAAITKVAITPTKAYASTDPSQNTIQFKATGIWSKEEIAPLDITSKVTWAITSGSAGTIDPPTGKFTAVSVGTATVNATYQGITSNNTVVTVGTETIKNITVTPASKDILFGFLSNFTAIDDKGNNVSDYCEWSTSDLAVGSFSNPEVPSEFICQGKGGACTVKAKLFEGVEGTAKVKVILPTNLNADKQPYNPDKPVTYEIGVSTDPNIQYPLSAWATYEEGPNTYYDVTRRVVWSYTGTCEHGQNVITVNPTNGLVTTHCTGVAEVTCHFPNLNTPLAKIKILVRWGQIEYPDKSKFIEELGTGFDPQIGVAASLYDQVGGLAVTYPTVGATFTQTDGADNSVVYSARKMTATDVYSPYYPEWSSPTEIANKALASSVTFVERSDENPGGVKTTTPVVAYQSLTNIMYKRYGYYKGALWVADFNAPVSAAPGLDPQIATDPKNPTRFGIAYEYSSLVQYFYNFVNNTTTMTGSVASLAYNAAGKVGLSSELGSTNKQVNFYLDGKEYPVEGPTASPDGSGYVSSLACNPVTGQWSIAYESSNDSTGTPLRTIKYKVFDGSVWIPSPAEVPETYPSNQTTKTLAAGRDFIDYGARPVLEFSPDGRPSLTYSSLNGPPITQGTVKYAYINSSNIWQINCCPFGTIDGWPAEEGICDSPCHKMATLTPMSTTGPAVVYVKGTSPNGKVVMQRRFSPPDEVWTPIKK